MTFEACNFFLKIRGLSKFLKNRNLCEPRKTDIAGLSQNYVGVKFCCKNLGAELSCHPPPPPP